MRSLLRQLSEHYAARESEDRKLSTYIAMRKHEGWEVHQEMMLILRGMIAGELLSDRFTKLDATEKDVQQRAYSYTNDLIDFLLNPLEKAVKRARFRQGFDQWQRGATSGSNP